MSTAVLFLLVALGVSTAGSTVLWLFSGRNRGAPTDYREQLRAIAPSRLEPFEQPSGIVSLDEVGAVEETSEEGH